MDHDQNIAGCKNKEDQNTEIQPPHVSLQISSVVVMVLRNVMCKMHGKMCLDLWGALRVGVE